MRVKHDALVEALDGRFDDHHAELARMLLDQIDHLDTQIDHLTARIGTLIAAIPAAQGVNADGTTGPGAGLGPDAPVLPAAARLDEVTGIAAQWHRTASFGAVSPMLSFSHNSICLAPHVTLGAQLRWPCTRGSCICRRSAVRSCEPQQRVRRGLDWRSVVRCAR